jgi:S-DNA-T family DNA segregation ATPase FtsK/SpoIIIE
MLLSLFSYSGSDPSPSTAGTFPVRNIGGVAGAVFWGFMLQYFGLASLVAVCAVCVAGRSLLSPSYLRRPLSVALLSSVIGALLLSAVLAYLSSAMLRAWPTPSGMGGLFGYMVREDIAAGLRARGITRYMHVVVFVLLSLTAAASMYFALNLSQDSILRFENFIAGIFRRRAAAQRGRSRIIETLRRVVPRKKAKAPAPSVHAPPPAQGKEERRPARGSSYALPSLGLLDPPRRDRQFAANDEMNEKKARMLENILAEFGVEGRIAGIKTGPVITLFEMEPGRGIKTSRITALAEDIARDMSALSARVAVIPGTNKIGVELPNAHRRTVYIREQFESAAFLSRLAAPPAALKRSSSCTRMFDSCWWAREAAFCARWRCTRSCAKSPTWLCAGVRAAAR